MEELRIPISRGTIFGMSAGVDDGPLVVGIHGWSQRNGWHTWQPLMQPLAEAGFRVISLDMPGWGQSESWSDGPLGELDAISAVMSVIDDVGAESAVLLGKSWGGGIALEMALSFPDKVTQLVLTAPAYRKLDKLGALRQPVIMAWAEDDPVIPYRYAADFVAVLPRVEVVSYPTGGHSAGPKNAGDFVVRVVEFLKSNMRQ